mgnify:FL=1
MDTTNASLYKEVKAYVKSKTIKGYSAPLAYGYYRLGDQLKFYAFGMPGVGYLPFISISIS